MQNSLFTNSCVTSQRILYTPSEFAKDSLTYLQETGTLTALKEHTSKRDSLDSYLFFIVEDGSGELVYNGTTFKLETNDCVFIDCSQPYSHKTSNDDLWTLKWIHFYGNNVGKIYKKYTNRGGKPIFKINNNEEFNKSYEEIYYLAKNPCSIKDMRINESLNHLLTLIMEQSRPNENANKFSIKKSLLDDIRKYIDNNFASKITLDDLAQQFFINKFYLLRIFKEQFGVTINDYLIRTRISKAKYLLRFSNKTIKEIGIETGIGPVNYFCRLFKKVEGVTPSTYKENW